MSLNFVVKRNFSIWSQTLKKSPSSSGSRTVASSGALRVRPVFKPHNSSPRQVKTFEKNLPYSDKKVKPWEEQNISKDVFFMRKYGNISPEERKKLDEKVARQRRLRNMRKEHERQEQEASRAERVEKRSSNDNWGGEDIRSYKKNSLYEYVYGTHSVKSALEANKRSSYNKLYVHNCPDKQLIKIAESKYGVKVIEKATKNDLNILCNNGVHNGVVLETKSLEFESIHSLGECRDNKYKVSVFEELDDTTQEKVKRVARVDEEEPTSKYPLGLFLDGITDPQNMGGIIRSAYYFGVDFIVVPTSNTARLGPVANKASVGSLDLMDIYECESSLRFIDNSRKNGWSVISTSAKPTAEELKELKSKHERVEEHLKNKYIGMDELPEVLSKTPVLLVMGSEGEGIRTHMKLRSDFLVGIEKGRKNDEIVDSLNVSVASGILISKCLESS
ncbi:Alpha/beta knot methyltransferase [Scheffersomyces xylosifermentans]|uniref:Alpha/beta knot methyltransferase n=1 Tax=Scheffersomyces xylosifermentans TaxID=1304137 RepID=UPI00315D47CE